MKLIKKVLAVLLTVALVCTVSGVYAQPLFNAAVTLNSSIKKGNAIILSYNETFDVDLYLKTGANYFAGPFSAQVFYTNSILKNSSADFNKSGKLYSVAKSYSDASKSSSMTASGVSRFYPKDWDTTQKSKYDFCNITMVPNVTDATVSVDSLNEKIVTMHFSSGTNTGSGSVFISASSVKSTDNATGETYLSCLTDNGKILSSRYDYGADASLDLSNATLSVVVSDAGDVDGNKKLNSSDALMVLQSITEIKALTGNALKRCDVNNDGAYNATDALSILQIATGLTRLNDIYKQ